jgi:hypothetical protein
MKQGFNYRWRQAKRSGRWFMDLPGRRTTICVFQGSDCRYGFSLCNVDQPGRFDTEGAAMAAAEKLVRGVQ